MSEGELGDGFIQAQYTLDHKSHSALKNDKKDGRFLTARVFEMNIQVRGGRT